MTDPLSLPLRRLTRPLVGIEAGSSLARGAAVLDGSEPMVAVVEDDRLVGVLRPEGLMRAFAAGADALGPVDPWLEAVEPLQAVETGAAALRRFEGDPRPLPVVGADGRPAGRIGPEDLFPRPRPRLRPPAIGGMATPFGVYLTTGGVSAGVSKWALLGTGATMFGLLVIGEQVTRWAAPLFDRLPDAAEGPALRVFALGLFLVSLRLIPMAGTHGAEHQVVHAIEREEPLDPAVVRRMPRVHPRCGTNFAAGASVFLGVFSLGFIQEEELRLLAAVVATAFLWRPLGSAMQSWFTTRRPTDRQLAGGIRAAEDLLLAYERQPSDRPPVWLRLWNSGLFHVMAGSLALFGVLRGVEKVFRVDLGLG